LFKKVREDEGIDWEKGELLHVARSLKADHVTCKEIGLRSVWISRGGDRKEAEGVGGNLEGLREKLGFEWRFDDLGTFAEEVERQLGDGMES
jgi:FMN phosphatase YigB (HAD superfamily)